MSAAELDGAQLDALVAKAEGHKGTLVGSRFLVHERADGLHVGSSGGGWHFAPSTNWSHGGPIIERAFLQIVPPAICNRTMVEGWSCYIPGDEDVSCCEQYGSTPLIAAMRAYVVSKIGREVE